MRIIATVDKNRVHCTGSLSKSLTTFSVLSFLAEKFDLNDILDSETFFDSIAANDKAREFLNIFQGHIGSRFSLHDMISYYAGLPYTFDVSADEIESVDAGNPFKHHSILKEDVFLDRCRHQITTVFPNRCKFHYSELSIIFLGYFFEKAFDISMEYLYQKYIIHRFNLENSTFSRNLPKDVYIQDLSDKYDYPSIAIQDHGYFCYSNGFYTCLNDMKKLVDNLLIDPVFQFQCHIQHARAASHRLMNGLTVEIRKVGDDLLYGYEGLSFSGCTIWAYSSKQKNGYITFSNDEDKVYGILYGKFGYQIFDPVPVETQEIYQKFIASYSVDYEEREIPLIFQGSYQRVQINEKTLSQHFLVEKHAIMIRNPEMETYPVIYANGHYCVKAKDKVPGSKVGFHTAKSGNHYLSFDGNLYKKCVSI